MKPELKKVQEMLEEATVTGMRMPRVKGPAGHETSLPEHVRDWASYGYDGDPGYEDKFITILKDEKPLDLRIGPPEAKAISDMDATLEAMEILTPEARKLLKARALPKYTLEGRAFRPPWRILAGRFRKSIRQLRRDWERGLTIVGRRLKII